MATHPAVYEGVLPKSFDAGTAITRYRFVVMASDGQIDHVGTANTIAPDGVSMDDQAVVGAPLAVATQAGSIVKVEAGAAVTAGGLVSSDNVGRAINFTSAAGNYTCGRALAAATAAGQIIPVVFRVGAVAA